jgi:membrane-associated phospholipid phosphatase
MYQDHKWVPVVSYSIATLVGLSRIYDNAHWASDVMAGAAVGFLSAKAMNGIYRKLSHRFLFLPRAGWHGGSVSLMYRF